MQNIPVPPGKTIRQELESRGRTVQDLEKMLKISRSDCRRLLHGGLKVTQRYAQILETELGIPKEFWLHLENCYRRARGERS